MDQSSNGQLVALLIVAGVVIAAVLLLVGLGVAVGVGVLIGVVVGLIAAIGAAGLFHSRSAFGWSVAERSSSGSDNAETILREHGVMAARVADVDAGALSRVLAVAEEADTGGVRVELIAVELRSDGGVASFVTHTRPPVAVPGAFALVRVADDADTEYVAAAQGGSQLTASTGRFELRFAPHPPPKARKLTLEIRQFVDPFPGSASRPVDGPWSFTIALGTSR